MGQGGLILAAGRVRSKKKKKRKKETRKNPAPPKTHHETHISPATAATSRRRAKHHVPHVSPYSPASRHTGFVEIGVVQLSQSVKTTDDTHTHADRRNKQWHPVRTPVLVERSMRQDGLILAAGRMRSTKKKSKRKHRKKICPTTKPTSAQRPWPLRDGARNNTSHTLAHTRPLP